MERSEGLNSFLKHGEEIIKDGRIAGGEIYLTNERIITNKVSLLKKISLPSKTSFSSIPLADIVSYRIARGMPFSSLPRLIVSYKEEKEGKEIFFEFTSKDAVNEFCSGISKYLNMTGNMVP